MLQDGHSDMTTLSKHALETIWSSLGGKIGGAIGLTDWF